MTRKEAKSFIIDISYDLGSMAVEYLTEKDGEKMREAIKVLEQEPKTGYCKDCKYFEYDSVARVDGIPLIVAHEICNKWGDGCKTKEDGYCFLFEPQERSGEECGK